MTVVSNSAPILCPHSELTAAAEAEAKRGALGHAPRFASASTDSQLPAAENQATKQGDSTQSDHQNRMALPFRPEVRVVPLINDSPTYVDFVFASLLGPPGWRRLVASRTRKERPSSEPEMMAM
jgi:hypothetical protein